MHRLRSRPPADFGRVLFVFSQSVGTGGRRRMEGDGPMRVSIDYSVQVLTLSEAAEVRSLFDSVEVDATSR